MTAAPVGLNRFEYDLVRLLRFLLGHLPAAQVASALNAERPVPECLSPGCVQLVQETLAKSLVRFLVHGGGWRDEAFLRDGHAVVGRVWNRLPVEERTLRFSARPLTFLIWLTAEKPTRARSGWPQTTAPVTLADHLFFLQVHQHLQQFPDHFAALRSSSVFQDNPLCHLANPALMDQPSPNFDGLFHSPGPTILESLQSWLTERWINIDIQKATITDWAAMRTAGEAESAALAAFLAAAENAGRRDLARFVLRAISKRLSKSESAMSRWSGGLSAAKPTRLADRIATRRAALSLVAQMPTLARWEAQSRTVSYYDDNSASAQWWKAEYEAYDGKSLAATADRLLRQIDPLHRTPE